MRAVRPIPLKAYLTLKTTVKKESSSIVESKFDALFFDNRNLSDFATQAETIGNQYKDALVAEGCSRSFADQMTINKMIEVCRKSARNDSIKCVLASATYDSHTAVLSKFRTEVALFKKERQQKFGSNSSNTYTASQNNNNSNQRNFRNNNSFHSNTYQRAPDRSQYRQFNNHGDSQQRIPNTSNHQNARVQVLNEQGNEEATRWSQQSEMETDQ